MAAGRDFNHPVAIGYICMNAVIAELGPDSFTHQENVGPELHYLLPCPLGQVRPAHAVWIVHQSSGPTGRTRRDLVSVSSIRIFAESSAFAALECATASFGYTSPSRVGI